MEAWTPCRTCLAYSMEPKISRVGKTGEPTPEDRLYRVPSSAGRAALEKLDAEPRYSIVSLGSIIGWTDLEYPFADDGRAAGWFRPAPAFSRVESTFALYQPGEDFSREHFRRYLSERNALSLQILEDGVTKVGAKVEVIRAGADGRYTIHVCFDDPFCDPPGPA